MPDAERDVSCTTPGCEGDARYPAPGRSHRPGCPYPMPALPVGTLTIPAAARLVPGDLIRVLGPRSWELVEPDDTRVTSPGGGRA